MTILVHIHFINVCLVGDMSVILIDEVMKRLLLQTNCNAQKSF